MTYSLGTRQVRIRYENNTGARFDCNADITEIVIGLKGTWHQVVNRLTHEALELCVMELGCRWAISPDYCEASDRFLFVMNHPQFSEVISRVAFLLVKCLPDVATEYNHAKRILDGETRESRRTKQKIKPRKK